MLCVIDSRINNSSLFACRALHCGSQEARSKLKNPGLLYPYHGSGRKRDPVILAKSAIVVTTYETLASDATYHAKKDGSENYVPPLEQVRWWRIICDESHTMRDAGTSKSEAVMNLVGDIKWLVSGIILFLTDCFACFCEVLLALFSS